jgi:hypothetical protein
LQIFQEALVIPISFPDVKGTLIPTVTAAFIDAVSTLWQLKIHTLTHKTFALIIDASPGFCLSISCYRLILLAKKNQEILKNLEQLKPILGLC